MSPHAVWSLARRERAVVLIIATLLLAGACALIFGPARGARDDIAQVRTDLHHSRHDIHRTLRTARTTLDGLLQELQVTQDSLAVARRGLDVAQNSNKVAHLGLGATRTIRQKTTQTLTTVREVIAALGPLRQLTGDIHSVVLDVRTGVRLARSTLSIGRETLSTGRSALAIAATTLDTLEQSRDIQVQLLTVARQTLHQVVEVNRKIPTPAIFPTSAPGR